MALPFICVLIRIHICVYVRDIYGNGRGILNLQIYCEMPFTGLFFWIKTKIVHKF